jgi:molybdopterin converting factor small subunit
MGSNVRVKVRIFAAPSMKLETQDLMLELSQNSTIQDLLNSIPLNEKKYVYIVREGVRLASTSRLNDGDEILIVPPITGG